MICPACGADLVLYESNDLEVDACPSCGGCWLDRGELDLLMGIDEGPTEAALLLGEHRSARRCPRCLKHMTTGRFANSSPMLDACPCGCGIWFDRGELKEMAGVEGGPDPAGRLAEYFGTLFTETTST